MKIRIVGGGPAGLFFAYLMARSNRSHDIRVYERDHEDATYGWGLVFSDVALSFVREIAPELYESITRDQVVFDSMAIVHKRQHVTLAGNTFHRIARLDRLKALHRHCRAAGVALEFEHRLDDITELAGCDLIVAADGANSSPSAAGIAIGLNRCSTSDRTSSRGTARRSLFPRYPSSSGSMTTA